MTYNIEFYCDGVKSKYGNDYGLDLEEAVEELQGRAPFIDYSEEEITDMLVQMSEGYVMRGSRWHEIKITKKL